MEPLSWHVRFRKSSVASNFYDVLDLLLGEPHLDLRQVQQLDDGLVQCGVLLDLGIGLIEDAVRILVRILGQAE